MNALRVGLALATAAFAGCASLSAEDGDFLPPPVFEPPVPYAWTRDEVVDEMLRVAQVKPGDVVYDLGCGDGRIVIAAAKQFGAHGVGIDIDPQRIAEARYYAKRAGVAELTHFRIADVLTADFRDATVVMLYMLPDFNRRLRPHLLDELKPGTRIVSHKYGFGDDWPPEQTFKVGNSTIYLWTVPPRN